MRCGISAKRLIMVSLSKAYSICALTLRTPISDKRVLPIVERRKFFILFIALKDLSACAEVTGIVTEMCKTLFITLRTRLWGSMKLSIPIKSEERSSPPFTNVMRSRSISVCTTLRFFATP